MPLSYVRYLADGVTTDFNITFPYLSKDHVFVNVDGSPETGFTFLNDTTVRMDVAPANGLWVEVRRTTPTDPLVDFEDSAVIEEGDLDTATRQAIYIAQEAYDQFVLILAENLLGELDADNRVIINLGDPTGEQDATTKTYVDAGDAAQQAYTDAEIAILEALIEDVFREAIVSETPPAITVDLKDNIFWFKPSTVQTFILYNDGNSRQWVLSSDPAQAVNHQIRAHEEYASGTAWANGSAGDNDRLINTVNINTIPGASVDTVTGIITLPAGNYEATISAPAATAGAAKHSVVLKNITDNTEVLVGTPVSIGGEGVDGNEARASDYFEIDGTKTFKVVQWMSAAMALGTVATVSGRPEKGATIHIKRLYG